VKYYFTFPITLHRLSLVVLPLVQFHKETIDGTFLFFFWILKLFGGLKPGVYRVEAALTGWDEEKFTERSELARIGRPFTAGEVPDSIRITLTPSAK
jgi:hypothetical protein